MAELQLKVVKNTGDGIWGKALNNFNKVFYSSGSGLFNLVINSKRNSLLRANANYVEMINIANEKKRNTIADKYERAYDGYLEALERHITDTVYTRVQKRVSTLKENRMLSDYYEVNSLKGTEYCEYKYRRQIMYLQMDWENILASNKSELFVSKYKAFYVNVVDQLYKGLMRHYSVRLTNQSENKEQVFQKIYDSVEDYIKLVLPYLEETEGRKEVLEGYKTYIQTIDLYAKKEINSIKRELYLLELGIGLFTYCLPILATEECYLDIISRCRSTLPNIYITADKFEMYNLLLDAKENYAYNVLSKKTLWDSEEEQKEFDEMWKIFDEYTKLKRIDFNEYKRLREILFIKWEKSCLNNSKAEAKELRAYYRERMKQVGGLRKFKNSYKKLQGSWRTRRRCQEA